MRPGYTNWWGAFQPLAVLRDFAGGLAGGADDGCAGRWLAGATLDPELEVPALVEALGRDVRLRGGGGKSTSTDLPIFGVESTGQRTNAEW